MADGRSQRQADQNEPPGILGGVPVIGRSPRNDTNDRSTLFDPDDEIDLYAAAIHCDAEDSAVVSDEPGFIPPEISPDIGDAFNNGTDAFNTAPVIYDSDYPSIDEPGFRAPEQLYSISGIYSPNIDYSTHIPGHKPLTSESGMPEAEETSKDSAEEKIVKMKEDEDSKTLGDVPEVHTVSPSKTPDKGPRIFDFGDDINPALASRRTCPYPETSESDQMEGEEKAKFDAGKENNAMAADIHSAKIILTEPEEDKDPKTMSDVPEVHAISPSKTPVKDPRVFDFGEDIELRGGLDEDGNTDTTELIHEISRNDDPEPQKEHLRDEVGEELKDVFPVSKNDSTSSKHDNLEDDQEQPEELPRDKNGEENKDTIPDPTAGLITLREEIVKEDTEQLNNSPSDEERDEYFDASTDFNPGLASMKHDISKEDRKQAEFPKEEKEDEYYDAIIPSPMTGLTNLKHDISKEDPDKPEMSLKDDEADKYFKTIPGSKTGPTAMKHITPKGELGQAEESPKIIKVKGIKETTTNDTLTYFFENKRKSGGGDVEKVLRTKGSPEAKIVFEDPKDASNVLKHGSLTLEGCKLAVSFEINDDVSDSEEVTKNTVPVKGIPDSAKTSPKKTLHAESQTFMNRLTDETEMATSDETTEGKHADTRSVMVRGFNPNTSQDLIHMYFENKKRSGGGPIEHIQHDAHTGTAIISFAEADAATRVLQKETLSLEGSPLHVQDADTETITLSPPAPQVDNKPIASIQVSGFTKSTTDDLLRIFFENKRACGGGDIKHIDLDTDSGVATLTYLDSKNATEVLRRGAANPFKLAGATLTVTELEPDVPAVSCAIEVMDFAAGTNEDYIIMFFENRKSGGEAIEEIHFDAANRRAVITYPNVEAPQRVLLKKPHTLDGCTLTIKMLKPARPAAVVNGPVDKSIIFISLIEEDTTAVDLVDFLQRAPECSVKQVYFGLTAGQALVEFHNIPDYETTRQLVSLKPLRGRMLSVQQVPLPNSIQVHNILGINKDLLSLYFENEKRSGGGPIVNLQLSDKDDYAIIEFSDREVLNKIRSKRHKLNETDLQVSMYYECLGVLPPSHDSSKPPTRLPAFIDITDTNPNIVSFITSSQKKIVEQEMDKLDCTVQWPNNIEEPLRFMRTIRRDGDYTRATNDWVKTVKDAWYMDIMTRYCTTKCKPRPPIWQDFLKQVGELANHEDHKVKIQVHEATCTVEICGITQAVNKVTHQLAEVQRELEAELDRASSFVTEQVALKQYQIFMLGAMKFEQTERDTFPEIKITNDEVSFTGLPHEITAAKIRMWDILSRILFQIPTTVPESVCRLLTKKPIRDHLANNFKEKDMCITWDVGKEGPAVYALTDDDLKKGINVITNEVIETNIPLGDKASILQTEAWKQMRDTLLARYANMLEINVSDEDGQVYVASISTECNLVMEEITTFIWTNETFPQRIVPLESATYKIVTKQMCCEIQKIATDLKSMMVDIQFKAEHGEHHIVIKGNMAGIALAEKRIQVLITGIVSRDLDIPNPSDTLCKAKLANGTEVFVCKGDLTTFNVGAIVNSANADLNLRGGLGYAIVQKGGTCIQDECYAHTSRNGKLLPGQVFTSGAGNLPCKLIHHALGPIWQGGRKGEENVIYTAISECLSATVKNRLDSVAIPALSTGSFAVPWKVSTGAIVTAVKEFCETERVSGRLRKVYLVDTQERIIDQFRKSLQFLLGDVELVDRHSAGSAGHRSVPMTPADRDSARSAGHRSVPMKPAAYNSFTKVDDDSLVNPQGVKITLYKGGIEAQQVDVIVNTASKNIDPIGGVSKAIFRAAGPGLKDETRNLAPLKPGSIAVSSGHKLQCSNIYHVHCTQWDGDNGNCEKHIKQIIAGCLATAAQSGHTSMAFPAIGTGNNSVPRDKCAELMYHQVSINPQTTVNDVRFVIYDKDTETIEAFEAEMHRRAVPSKVGRVPGEMHVDTSGVDTIELDTSELDTSELDTSEVDTSEVDTSEVDTSESPSTPMSHGSAAGSREPNASGMQVSVGSVKLQLELGDITAESTDAIVNSTNGTIDLTKGGVSRALAKAAGPQFVQECKQAVMDEKVAITSGGNLRAKNVIHIVAPSGEKKWRKVIRRTLAKADQLRYRSLSFPALGTGQLKVSGSVMANVMLDTIEEFAKSNPDSVQLIRIVIHPVQPKVLETFITEIKKKGSLDMHRPQAAEGLGTRTKEREYLDAGLLTTSPPSQGITVRVWARTTEGIDVAMKELKAMCNDEWQEKVIGGLLDQDNISKLSDMQIERIKRLERQFAVKITIEISGLFKRICVQGNIEVILSVVDIIYTIFLDNTTKEHLRSDAELVKKQVQWFFEDANGLKEYPADLNLQIEEAFGLKLPEVECLNQDGEKFKIDFKGMVETQIGSAGASVKVHRKPKGVAVELPSNWTPVDPSSDDVLVPLPATHSEYQELQSKLMSSAGGHVQKIISIDRVQNSSLFQRYVARSKRMVEANPSGNVENVLWHGTSVDAMDSVNRYGFNRSYCAKHAAALGNGVYFAKNASYACASSFARPDPNTGQKHVYMCKVLTGDYAAGAIGLIDPPVKSGKIRYDSVVDSVQNPSIFVIFSDTQAYPEYHITFF